MLLLKEYLRINLVLFIDTAFDTGPDIPSPLQRAGWMGLACEYPATVVLIPSVGATEAKELVLETFG